jgi:hypothetical protein
VRTRHPKRSRHLLLLVAAFISLLLGYYLGSQQQRSKLEKLPVELFKPPVTLTKQAFPAGVARAAEDTWQMALIGDSSLPACEKLLTHYIEVHNRLAAYPEIQNQLQLALLDLNNGSVSPLWQHITWAKTYPITQQQTGQLFSTLQLANPGNRWCQDVQANSALLSPGLQLYAHLPLAKPGDMAHNLKVLLETLNPHVN